MNLQLNIKINEGLYLKNPEGSELGKNIIKHSIIYIHRYGFDAFTFKKLAEEIGSTEASIYRYFENKHRLLLYLLAWYWGWLEFQIRFQTNNLPSPVQQLQKVIDLLTSHVEDDLTVSHVNESLLYKIVISEGSKAYLTNHVEVDNQHKFFKPYKDLVATIAAIITACNSEYKYPRSLATTIVEMAHFQHYFMMNLPSLTDFGDVKEEASVTAFLNDLVFNRLA